MIYRKLYCASLVVFVLLSGGNWNNARNAGIGYLNSNNTASNSNRNNGTRIELKVRPLAALNSSLPEPPEPRWSNTQPFVNQRCSTLFGNLLWFDRARYFMKRYGNLYSDISGHDNLFRSHTQARSGKSHYTEVKMVDTDPDRYLNQIHELLVTRSFNTAPYTTKQIYEPKERTIYKLPYYPDRIVHHAIMNIIQPIWDRVFISDLYSAIPGKGLHAGSYRLRKFLKDKENTRYCLKFDITKYYPSINHDILIGLINKKIKCKDTLWILENIIRSIGGTTNAPIGNYLSQYFGNIYLNWFDHWVKETLHRSYYIRYCDDGVILGSTKTEMSWLKEEIETYLETNLSLKLNKKTQITEVDKTGIDFLGYRCFRDYTLLRQSSTRRFKKRIHFIETHHQTMSPQQIISSIMSYHGWLKHCDSYHLQQKYLFDNPRIISIMDTAAKDLGITNPMYRITPTTSP